MMDENTIDNYLDFRDAVDKGWGEWQRLDTLKRKDITVYCGVYEIATTKPFPRLKGTTTILYIGKALKGYYGLRSRLGGLTTSSGRRALKERIYPIRDQLSECLWIRVRVIPPDDVGATEQALFFQFEKAHLELPPCNRKGA